MSSEIEIIVMATKLVRFETQILRIASRKNQLSVPDGTSGSSRAATNGRLIWRIGILAVVVRGVNADALSVTSYPVTSYPRLPVTGNSVDSR
jgi:hypothetical protein